MWRDSVVSVVHSCGIVIKVAAVGAVVRGKVCATVVYKDILVARCIGSTSVQSIVVSMFVRVFAGIGIVITGVNVTVVMLTVIILGYVLIIVLHLFGGLACCGSL